MLVHLFRFWVIYKLYVLYILRSHLELLGVYFKSDYQAIKEVYKSMKSSKDEEVIRVYDEGGDLIWLSDAGVERLCLVLTGIMALAITPIFAVMILM